MKKLFFTLATVATITFNYANASTDAELPANLAHIEITDDAAHCNEKEGEILEVKPLFSEGSFSKTFFDKVVEVNSALNVGGRGGGNVNVDDSGKDGVVPTVCQVQRLWRHLAYVSRHAQCDGSTMSMWQGWFS